MPYLFQSYGRSELGQREVNEDYWMPIPGDMGFVLADGLGGHQAGEIAAHEAVTTCCENLLSIQEQNLSDEDVEEVLMACVDQVNHHVRTLGDADLSLTGMGTTLCILLFHKDQAVFTHVGDSRIYHIRNRTLDQLTQDHSLINRYLEEGEIKEEDLVEFGHNHILTQAIGTPGEITPVVGFCPLKLGDRYLLCSDGLSDVVTFDEIEEILSRDIGVREAVDALVRAASHRGSDNVTAVLVEVMENE